MDSRYASRIQRRWRYDAARLQGPVCAPASRAGRRGPDQRRSLRQGHRSQAPGPRPRAPPYGTGWRRRGSTAAAASQGRASSAHGARRGVAPWIACAAPDPHREHHACRPAAAGSRAGAPRGGAAAGRAGVSPLAGPAASEPDQLRWCRSAVVARRRASEGCTTCLPQCATTNRAGHASIGARGVAFCSLRKADPQRWHCRPSVHLTAPAHASAHSHGRARGPSRVGAASARAPTPGRCAGAGRGATGAHSRGAGA